MNEAEERREWLERRATEVRSRLEERLDAIDDRRHRLLDAARRTVKPPISIIVAAVVGLAAALFIAQRWRARHKPVPRLARLFPASPREKHFAIRGLEKAGVSLVAAATQRVGTRGLDRWLSTPEHGAVESIAARTGQPGAGRA